jgi:hypothetical protein
MTWAGWFEASEQPEQRAAIGFGQAGEQLLDPHLVRARHAENAARPAGVRRIR